MGAGFTGTYKRWREREKQRERGRYVRGTKLDPIWRRGWR